MSTFKKEYINEEKARFLFIEYLNTEANGTDFIIEELFEDEFQEWLDDNNYHCQVQEYDKYED